MVRWLFKIFYCFPLLLAGCQWRTPLDKPIDLNKNQISTVIQQTLDHGDYWQYIPRTIQQPASALVIVHGSVGAQENAIDNAKTMLGWWIDTAEQEGVILIAPAFDSARYGGKAGPGGGYRGLFGRDVGADEFLLQIIDNVRQTIWIHDTFYLYGHSAGGQFVNRFVVMHPQRIKRAVISAAGFFAYPEPNVSWANGMGTLKRSFKWCDTCPEKQKTIKPNAKGWLKAAALPIAVVVGSKDTANYGREVPGQLGDNHVSNGRAWVEAMRQYAKDKGGEFQMIFLLVEGAGHSSRQTLSASIQYLLEMVIVFVIDSVKVLSPSVYRFCSSRQENDSRATGKNQKPGLRLVFAHRLDIVLL